MEGTISSHTEFISELDSERPVAVCVDGPTWNVEELSGEYPEESINALKVRKLGLITGRTTLVVYESEWGT